MENYKNAPIQRSASLLLAAVMALSLVTVPALAEQAELPSESAPHGIVLQDEVVAEEKDTLSLDTFLNDLSTDETSDLFTGYAPSVLYDTQEDCEELIIEGGFTDNKSNTPSDFTATENTSHNEVTSEIARDKDTLEIESSASGSCGSKAEWAYNAGVLTIKGTGSTDNHESNVPWSDYTESIKKIEVKNGITSLPKQAFAGLYKVTSISLPNSLNSIDSYAFMHCEALKSITIPKNVTSISAYAFALSGLTSINVDSGNKTFSAEDGVLFNKAQTVLYFYPEHKQENTYLVPDGVTVIATSAFSDNKNFSSRKSPTTVILPSSLVSIKANAFSFSSVSKMKFCGNPPSIEKNAFKDFEGHVYYPNDNSSWSKDDFTLNSSNCNDKWSSWNASPKPTISSAKQSGQKMLTITWSCANGATGYELQYSKSSWFNNASKVDCSDKNAEISFNGSKIYVRVRSYRKSGGVTYHSAWSKTKTISA